MSVRYIWSKNQVANSYSFTQTKSYDFSSDDASAIDFGTRLISSDDSKLYVLLMKSKPTLTSATTAKYTGMYRLSNASYRTYNVKDYPWITVVANGIYNSNAMTNDGFPSNFSVDNDYIGTLYLDDSWGTTDAVGRICTTDSGPSSSQPANWYLRVGSNSSGKYTVKVDLSGYHGDYIYEYGVKTSKVKGSFVSWVSSGSPSAYPNYGISSSYFYESETQDVIDPSGIDISGTIVPGTEARIILTPSSSAQSNSYGKISYNYEYQYDDSGGWNSAGAYSDTSFALLIEKGHATVKVRAKAKDDIGFESSVYVESGSYPISSLSSLVISNYEYGEDGNIGKVHKDIEFVISEEGESSVYTMIVYNGNYSYELEVTSNTKYYVNILDLLVGEGEELKFVFISAAGVSSEKTFIYTKDAQVFPSDNIDIGILRMNGKDSYPMTVAEAIRTSGGSTLDVLLNSLLGKINEISSSPPDYRERNILMDYSDADGSNTITMGIDFTAYKGSAFAMLMDFDFSGLDGANLICVGGTPESWNDNCIRFYVVNSGTYGFTAHFFDNTQAHITVDQSITGHHRLVFRCKCQGANSVSAWMDGKSIIENAGSSFYAGSWSMSNAEGKTRFKGTYNEISILKPYLTDEQYLEISKLE